MQIERIAVPDVERTRQAQLLPDAEGKDPAVDEHDRARPRRGDVEEPADAIVMNGEVMHRGEQAHSA